jgi:hypothetical protein
LTRQARPRPRWVCSPQLKPTVTKCPTKKSDVGHPKATQFHVRWTLDHATRHLPPCTTSKPAQRKPFMMRSIAFQSHGRSSMLIAVYNSMAARVVLTRVRRPCGGEAFLSRQATCRPSCLQSATKRSAVACTLKVACRDRL